MYIVPKLLELCLNYLLEHLDDVETFEGIDSALKATLLARILNKDSSLANVLKLLDENTTSIDLSGYIFNKEMPFDKLFSRMKSLNTISICGHVNLNDLVMENMMRWCPTLKVINLHKSPRITDRSIALVRANCPNLERLHMRYCIGISGVAFCSKFLWGDHLPPNANTNDKNKSSKKQAPRPPIPPSISYFTNLVELDISECRSIIPANLIPLNQLFPALQTLAIGKLFLGDEDAEEIIKTAPATLTSLAILALCAPSKRNQFTSLNFKQCRCIVQDSNASFANILRDIPNLTSLDLSQCYQIGEDAFLQLADDELHLEIASNLLHLDLSNCGVTDKTVKHLSELGLARSLRELYLTTYPVLTSIPIFFPNLEFVEALGCHVVIRGTK